MNLHRLLPLVLALALVSVSCASRDNDNSPTTPGATPDAAASEAAQYSAVETGLVSSPASAVLDDDAAFEDYDDEHIVVIADPLEPWNRFWFGFNHLFIMGLVKPVYTGYETVTPVEMRSGLSNMLNNLMAPVRIVNRLLQGEPSMAGVEFGRFIANSTAGFGGLINIAAKDKPLVPFSEYGANFGTTLSVWGVGEGIYLVWPFMGPSTARGSVGMVGDYFATPFYWGSQSFAGLDYWLVTGTEGGLRFNDMGSALTAYEALTKSAVEPYTAMRDAYIKLQRSGMNPERPGVSAVPGMAAMPGMPGMVN